MNKIFESIYYWFMFLFQKEHHTLDASKDGLFVRVYYKSFKDKCLITKVKFCLPDWTDGDDCKNYISTPQKNFRKNTPNQ